MSWTPRRTLLAATAAVFAVVIGYATYVKGDVGVVKTDAAGISVRLSAAEADATTRLPLVLAEGSGIEHESDHVFAALRGLPGIGRVLITADGTAIEVAYDGDEIGPKQIRDAVAAAGYTQ